MRKHIGKTNVFLQFYDWRSFCLFFERRFFLVEWVAWLPPILCLQDFLSCLFTTLKDKSIVRLNFSCKKKRLYANKYKRLILTHHYMQNNIL